MVVSSFRAGVTGLLLVAIAAPSSATNARERSPAFPPMAQRRPLADASRFQQARTRGDTGSGMYSYIGAMNLGNSADGAGGAVGAGDQQSAVVGYAASERNDAGLDSFVGAGAGNSTVGGNASFVGGGDNDAFTGYEVCVDEADSQEEDPDCSTTSNAATGARAFLGSGDLNTDTGIDAAEGAGDSNSVSGQSAFLGSGNSNTLSAENAFLGGGNGNDVTSAAEFASNAGGNSNYISAPYGAIGGGSGNKAEGAFSVVPGGADDLAYGVASFAGGYHAYAAHNGSFVWSDEVSGSTRVSDSAKNQFIIRASGGTIVYSNEGLTSGVELPAGSGTWSSLSDRNAKTAIEPADDALLLAGVAMLPVSSWQYTTEPGVLHVGPMAQDFYAAFHVGEDDRHITSIDEDGAVLGALKTFAVATDGDLRQSNDETVRLHAENQRLRATLSILEARIQALSTTAARRALR